MEHGKKIWAAFDERDRRKCLSFAQANWPPADAARQRPCLAVFLFPWSAIHAARLCVNTSAVGNNPGAVRVPCGAKQ